MGLISALTEWAIPDRISTRHDAVYGTRRRWATGAMAMFVTDLTRRGYRVARWQARPDLDHHAHHADGRYAYTVTLDDGRCFQVQMPGLRTRQVRYLGRPGENVWDFPQVYVDGKDQWWLWALDLGHDKGGEH